MAKFEGMHNLYEILGVKKDASMGDIKKAYRVKALFEHPDKGGDDQIMALLNTAYQVLSDPTERGKFDHDWKVFNETYETETPSLLLHSLPAAGVAFSKSYREQHAEYAKQCRKEPLDRNQTKSHLKDFRSDVYYCNDNRDLFSFIKARKNSETKLVIEQHLTPQIAVEYFIHFLQGAYSGNSLIVLGKAYYQKIKQLETSGEQGGYEFKLYCGIYEILLVAIKEKTPSANILFSLDKITEFAKHNPHQTISFMAPLFQGKYFRNLFSQALHYYWLSEESVLDESYKKAFNGEAAAKSFFENLKSKLCENRSAGKSNDAVATLLRYVRLLHRLEQDLSKSEPKTTANCAAFYREKAFHLLDWVPSLIEFAGRATAANTLLQIAMTLETASAREWIPELSMADEKLAAEICLVAASICRHEKPDIELYACVHSIKCLLSCRFTDSNFKQILEALQHRALWLADMFPFFQSQQSNADFMAKEDKTLELMRQLLHVLMDKIDDQNLPSEKNGTDHSYARVVYQAYEACLKNWYENEPDTEKENKFRQRLMKELLMCKQWTAHDINYNIRESWPLNDIDEEGWTFSGSPTVKDKNIETYRGVRGVQLNYKTGKIDFILDHCKNGESDYNRLLTIFDLSELFQRRLAWAIFSLDPVDPDMPYHPFNHMFIKPSTIQHSQLVHAMFLADYLLKFLTVGKEVRRHDPYELRSLDQLVSKLPDYLKKVIYDFHASSHEESLSRFWIEQENVELAISDEGLNEAGDVLFALGNIRMVVKHHKMKRDAEGNLVDAEGEDEGWDCYILSRDQKQELLNGKRVIEGSALIIIKWSWEFVFWEILFWENNKATFRFIPEEDEFDLISLSNRQRDNQGKIKVDDSESLRQIYRVVLKAAKKTRMPHRYSPEFIFAQEFTKYYDDFATYFTEFGRLRELSKAVSLVNVMAAQREANEEEVRLIKRRLNYKHFCGLQAKQSWQIKEHEYWQTTTQKLKQIVREAVEKQFKEWREKLSKEKVEQKRKEMLTGLRLQIGTLEFNSSSPEVRDICDRVYEKIKRDIIAEHGYSGWNSVSHKVYREAIEPKIPTFIAELRSHKKAAVFKQLSELFEDELSGCSRLESTRLIERFLEGNSKPLLDHFVYYDRTEIAKKIKEVFPGHTIDTLDKALNSFEIDEIVDKETEKAVKEHEQKLVEQLEGREKLEKSYTNLGFGDDAEEINGEDICSWVPSSFRHDIEKGHSRTVYGGVCISGKVDRVSNSERKQFLFRKTNEFRKLSKNNISVRELCTHFGLSVDKIKKEMIPPKHLNAFQRQTTPGGKQVVGNNLFGKTVEKVAKYFLEKWLSVDPTLRVNSKFKKYSTAYGNRKMDLVIERRGKDGEFKPLLGIEVKSGRSPYVRPQKDGQQTKKPTPQGMQDDWKEKQKDGFPIILLRFDKDP